MRVSYHIGPIILSILWYWEAPASATRSGGRCTSALLWWRDTQLCSYHRSPARRLLREHHSAIMGQATRRICLFQEQNSAEQHFIPWYDIMKWVIAWLSYVWRSYLEQSVLLVLKESTRAGNICSTVSWRWVLAIYYFMFWRVSDGPYPGTSSRRRSDSILRGRWIALVP